MIDGKIWFSHFVGGTAGVRNVPESGSGIVNRLRDGIWEIKEQHASVSFDLMFIDLMRLILAQNYPLRGRDTFPGISFNDGLLWLGLIYRFRGDRKTAEILLRARGFCKRLAGLGNPHKPFCKNNAEPDARVVQLDFPRERWCGWESACQLVICCPGRARKKAVVKSNACSVAPSGRFFRW